MPTDMDLRIDQTDRLPEARRAKLAALLPDVPAASVPGDAQLEVSSLAYNSSQVRFRAHSLRDRGGEDGRQSFRL